MNLSKSLRNLEKRTPDSRQRFRNISKCLRESAKYHDLTTFDILLALDSGGKYRGIREWYMTLAEKWWKPLALKFTGTRKQAEKLISTMNTLVTGARSEEIVVGIGKQSRGAVLRMVGQIIPPSEQSLDIIRGYDDLWERFLGRLNSVRFFSGMSRLEREMYLEEVQSTDDIYFQDVKNLDIQVLSFGSSDFLKLSENKLEALGDVQAEYSAWDVFDMFPRKPGSEGLKGRHTLIFRRELWSISSVYNRVQEFEGLVVDVDNGDVVRGEMAAGRNLVTFGSIPLEYKRESGRKSSTFTISEKQTVGFLFANKERFRLSKDKDLKLVKKATQGFTAASYKSLMQKTIRFRPRYVDVLGEYIPGERFLRLSLYLLFANVGSFVPDIQRFVSGSESALKRVAVTLFEDSSFSYEEANDILSLVGNGFLSQRLPGWRPSSAIVEKTVDLATRGYLTDRAYVYDIEEGMKLTPYCVSGNTLETISALIDEMRSFPGDLAMIRYNVSKMLTASSTYVSYKNRPEVMKIEHCVDQHWAPEISYMFPMDIVRKYAIPGSEPFKKLLAQVFRRVTGVNPRRVDFPSDFEGQPFVKKTRRAQNLVLLAKQITPEERSLAGDQKYSLKYELDDGWLAGMLGAIEVKGRPPALVTLHPDDPELLVAVRKPSRNMKDPFLSDEREAKVIEEVKNRLLKGIPLRQTAPPVPSMKGSILRRTPKGEYLIKLKSMQEWFPWDDFKKGTLHIPYVENIDLTLENAMIYGGTGIERGADVKLKKVLSRTSQRDIQKAITYIGDFSQTFEFRRISRDGGGTQGAVSIEDIGAFHLLMKVKLLYPSALERVKGSALKYRVPVGPLLWHVRDVMVEFLQKSLEADSSAVSAARWGNLGDRLGRKPWEHQTTSLKELKDANRKGRKGSFIWIDVGMGKTMIVLSYLRWLIRTDSPKYIFYTLPSSAIKSIISEIEGYGFDYRVLVPLKTLDKSYRTPSGKIKKHIIQGCTPMPYVINLIKHDHLRRCEEDLLNYMPESILVIDEVHKALNDSKRTAVALQLSHLSREFVALTGTPIIDSNTYKLIWWLEQIVPFEVNEKNFWVAANGMVAKKVSTGVKVNRKDRLILMTPTEEKQYGTLVPPKLGGNNTQPRSEDFQRAMKLCYSVVDRGIIQQTLKSLSRGDGVFIVAKDVKHQTHLKNLLIQKDVIQKDIFLIGKDQSIFLTDESVKNKKVPGYRVVITTIRHSEGYTLTRLNTMISGVYPSNNATRIQLEGRINRISQNAKMIRYYILHTGILTYILQHHNDARNLSAVLSAIAEDI